VLAHEQRDRRGAQRSPAARASCGGRRRQARPAGATRQTQAVEPLRIVVGHARGQDIELPRGGRDLAPVELLEHLREAARAGDALRLGHVLPVEQEAHEVRRRDRLDLRAQAVQRVAMDAREQAPLATTRARPSRA
jgi:hypothetical protein